MRSCIIVFGLTGCPYTHACVRTLVTANWPFAYFAYPGPPMTKEAFWLRIRRFDPPGTFPTVLIFQSEGQEGTQFDYDVLTSDQTQAFVRGRSREEMGFITGGCIGAAFGELQRARTLADAADAVDRSGNFRFAGT